MICWSLNFFSFASAGLWSFCDFDGKLAWGMLYNQANGTP